MPIDSDNLAAKVVGDALERGYGDRTAVREPGRSWTYSALEDAVTRFATALRTLRVGRGDRVAVLMPDSLEAATAILGAVYAGAVAVPISELARPVSIRDILIEGGAAVAVVHKSLEPALDSVRSETPSLREVLVVGGSGPGERDFGSLIRGAARLSNPATVDPDSAALLLYSTATRAGESGRTTHLRGVAHSHKTPLLAFESFGRGFLSLGEDDRVFSVVRLSTAYGLGSGLLFPLLAGAEAALLPGKPHTGTIVSMLSDVSPTVMIATPSVYRQLALDHEESGQPSPLGGLRRCVSGAEDMPPRLRERVERVLGIGADVGYGLTEAFQFVTGARTGDAPSGSSGVPLPEFEVRIVGDGGQEVADNEIGTLSVRGPTMCRRYWGDEQDCVDRDGWFSTLDRFMRDGEGNLYHCGRVDQLFKVGGKWVDPSEVERALLAHEAVWECAVVSADDEDGLLKPLAFVVANIGHEPGDALSAELREHVKSELSPYMYPRWIEFVDELPKGKSGRVLRYKLHEKLRGGPPRRAETQSS